MPRIVLDPLVLLMVLVGLVFWAFSLLTTIPGSWWVSWGVGIVFALALALFVDARRRTR